MVKYNYLKTNMLQKLFGFDPTQHKVRTEIFAGITTFLTMAYTKEPVIKKSAELADFLLDQYSRLLAIGGIAGFVSELALLHERDGVTITDVYVRFE